MRYCQVDVKGRKAASVYRYPATCLCVSTAQREQYERSLEIKYVQSALVTLVTELHVICCNVKTRNLSKRSSRLVTATGNRTSQSEFEAVLDTYACSKSLGRGLQVDYQSL